MEETVIVGKPNYANRYRYFEYENHFVDLSILSIPLNAQYMERPNCNKVHPVSVPLWNISIPTPIEAAPTIKRNNPYMNNRVSWFIS